MIDNKNNCNKTVAFHSLGCKLNFLELSYIGKLLLNNGYRKVIKDEEADICIINTCSVTEVADRKDRQAIKQMIKKNPNAFVIVTGCYAQLKPEEIGEIEGVDLVLGTQQKFDILNYLSNGLAKKTKTILQYSKHKDIVSFFPSCTRGDRTRYYLKVQDGCDYFCTYCTIPIARGKSRNASIKDTVLQAQKAINEGAHEIVITGVNIGDFGKTTGETFFDLIKALDDVDGFCRYRISSIEPDLLTDEIIEYTSHSDRFMPHFHIPLQSGSDTVLKLMKRHYVRSLFASRICKIKELMPDAFIGVDVIVGANGETKECFSETYDFLNDLNVSQLHVFPYSERDHTAALKIGNKVSSLEKKQRALKLHELSEKKLHSFIQSQIGNEAEVLWEEKKKGKYMHGFTSNYIKVQREYDASFVNKVQTVKLGDFNEDGSCLVVEYNE